MLPLDPASTGLGAVMGTVPELDETLTAVAAEVAPQPLPLTALTE